MGPVAVSHTACSLVGSGGGHKRIPAAGQAQPKRPGPPTDAAGNLSSRNPCVCQPDKRPLHCAQLASRPRTAGRLQATQCDCATEPAAPLATSPRSSALEDSASAGASLGASCRWLPPLSSSHWDRSRSPRSNSAMRARRRAEPSQVFNRGALIPTFGNRSSLQHVRAGVGSSGSHRPFSQQYRSWMKRQVRGTNLLRQQLGANPLGGDGLGLCLGLRCDLLLLRGTHGRTYGTTDCGITHAKEHCMLPIDPKPKGKTIGQTQSGRFRW